MRSLVLASSLFACAAAAAQLVPGLPEKPEPPPTLGDAARSALVARGIDMDDVRVETEGRRLVLEGSVPRDVEKSEASETLLRVNGIEEIENRLVVRGPTTTDGDRARDLRRALQAQRELGDAVDVHVQDAVATLRGTVPTLALKQRALMVARAADIADVRDEIVVAAPRVDDAALELAVTRALDGARGLEPGEVRATVMDGAVRLRGEVDSREERARAVEVASHVVGVVAVEDDALRVGDPVMRTP